MPIELQRNDEIWVEYGKCPAGKRLLMVIARGTLPTQLSVGVAYLPVGRGFRGVISLLFI